MQTGTPAVTEAHAAEQFGSSSDLRGQSTIEYLESRLGKETLRRRLEIESQGDAIGQGLTFFHPETWLRAHSLMKTILRFTGLLGRGQRNALQIRLTSNEIELTRWPSGFGDLRILQISDLHLDMNEAFPTVLAGRVADLEYDLCVLTGDYRFKTHGDSETALTGMAMLRERLRGPVYAILGNHDSVRMVPSLEQLGIQVLLNESVPITRSAGTVYLAGIDDPHYFGTDDIPAAMADIPNESVSILLSHTPEVYAHGDAAGFDVMLCGHTHGGQIALPGGMPLMVNARCPRKFCRGAWRFGQLNGYTSVGAGSTFVDARFNCPPEVVIHRLSGPV